MKNYSYQPPKKARFAAGRAEALNISPKDSREVALSIRRKNVSDAEAVLRGVVEMRRPIRFTRHNTELGHKPGIGPGRFPVNAAREMLTVLLNAKSNAKSKGLDEKKLRVAHVSASRSLHKRPGGARAFAKGPSNRSRRTSIQIVLEESNR